MSGTVIQSNNPVGFVGGHDVRLLLVEHVERRRLRLGAPTNPARVGHG